MDLNRLIAKGESENLEFKKTTGQRSEAAKTITAFLNGSGGILLFGVSDQGKAIGQEVSTKTVEQVTAELRRIDPPVFPEMEIQHLKNGKAIISIHVPGKFGTYTYDGRPYVRQGPTTRIMPREEYERRILEKFHSHQRWENEFAPEWVTIEHLDIARIEEIVRSAIELGRIKKPLHTDTTSILRGFGLIVEDRLINAAVALFGKKEKLAAQYPQLSLRLAKFRGMNR